MNAAESDWKALLNAVQEMRVQLQDLSERVARVESTLASHPGPAATAGAPESPPEQLLTVIGAAVAAYLGERAHLRKIRLLSGNSWMHQGRATVQASHALTKSN